MTAMITTSLSLKAVGRGRGLMLAVLLAAAGPAVAQQHLPGQYIPPGAYVPPGTIVPPTGPIGPPPGFPTPRSTAPSTITPEQERKILQQVLIESH